MACVTLRHSHTRVFVQKCASKPLLCISKIYISKIWQKKKKKEICALVIENILVFLFGLITMAILICFQIPLADLKLPINKQIKEQEQSLITSQCNFSFNLESITYRVCLKELFPGKF